jgi:hypothetical protein
MWLLVFRRNILLSSSRRRWGKCELYLGGWEMGHERRKWPETWLRIRRSDKFLSPHNMMMTNGSSFSDAVYIKYSRHNISVLDGERPSLLFCIDQHSWLRFCFPPLAHNWKRDNNLKKKMNTGEETDSVIYCRIIFYYLSFLWVLQRLFLCVLLFPFTNLISLLSYIIFNWWTNFHHVNLSLFHLTISILN